MSLSPPPPPFYPRAHHGVGYWLTPRALALADSMVSFIDHVRTQTQTDADADADKDAGAGSGAGAGADAHVTRAINGTMSSHQSEEISHRRARL